MITNQNSIMCSQFKMSHSIHMLSIQIDIKRLESVQQRQIVLLCEPYETEYNSYYFKTLWLSLLL